MGIQKLSQELDRILSALFIEEGRLGTLKRMLNERHKILLVLTGMESDADAVQYALNLSRRIGAGIKILYCASSDSETPLLEESLKKLKTIGIDYQIALHSGSIKEKINRFIDSEKEADINFVVIDSRDLGIQSIENQKVNFEDWEKLNCPLVLVSKTSKYFLPRRLIMAQKYRKLKKKPVGKMVAYGMASLALYAALFMNQGAVTALFTRGAWYAFFPIATAFAFSFVHGGFTGYFWSVLGLEATKRSLRSTTEEKKHLSDREHPQPRPRLRARL